MGVIPFLVNKYIFSMKEINKLTALERFRLVSFTVKMLTLQDDPLDDFWRIPMSGATLTGAWIRRCKQCCGVTTRLGDMIIGWPTMKREARLNTHPETKYNITEKHGITERKRA